VATMDRQCNEAEGCRFGHERATSEAPWGCRIRVARDSSYVRAVPK
jgi:hypothetical protein